MAGEFLHRKVYNPLVKLSRSVSRGAREGLEGARGEGLLRAVCAVRRVADAVGLWRQEHKADMQVRWSEERCSVQVTREEWI